jgi:S-adenosylmethionine:tRNA ribosyltransferase-isomerase
MDGWSVSPTPDSLPTSAFSYELPDAQIARYPATLRDESRLLVLDHGSDDIEHRTFRDIANLIAPGDVLVLNETRVLPGRLTGHRPTGGRAEILLLHPVQPGRLDDDRWVAMVKPGARLRPGGEVHVAADLVVEILETTAEGNRVVRLRTPGSVFDAIRRLGHVPLPPYIDRDDDATDSVRYQTVYARDTGSIAAPTAGLHFTGVLLERLEQNGVNIARIVLHVGPGTFRPVETEDPAQHAMHSEPYHVPAAAAKTINDARAGGGRVWAVGTTVVRTLEAVAARDGSIAEAHGSTNLFIRPGYEFRVVDNLITNFHLPRSTLLMLVCALAGYEATMHAYDVAVRMGYRFYSYGDAMAVRGKRVGGLGRGRGNGLDG